MCKLHPICDASFPPHNSYEAQDKYVDSTQYVMEKRPGESRDGDPGTCEHSLYFISMSYTGGITGSYQGLVPIDLPIFHLVECLFNK